MRHTITALSIESYISNGIAGMKHNLIWSIKLRIVSIFNVYAYTVVWCNVINWVQGCLQSNITFFTIINAIFINLILKCQNHYYGLHFNNFVNRARLIFVWIFPSKEPRKLGSCIYMLIQSYHTYTAYLFSKEFIMISHSPWNRICWVKYNKRSDVEIKR